MTLVRYNQIVQALQRRNWTVHCWRIENSGSATKWLAAGQHPQAHACVGAGGRLGEALADLFSQSQVAEAAVTRLLPPLPAFTTAQLAASDKTTFGQRNRFPNPRAPLGTLRSAARPKSRARLRFLAFGMIFAFLAIIEPWAQSAHEPPKEASRTEATSSNTAVKGADIFHPSLPSLRSQDDR